MKLFDAARVCADWSAKHATVFDPKKFQLVYFRAPGAPQPVTHSILYGTGSEVQLIEPADKMKILGVWIDQNLNFRHHVKVARVTALKRLSQLSVIDNTCI